MPMHDSYVDLSSPATAMEYFVLYIWRSYDTATQQLFHCVMVSIPQAIDTCRPYVEPHVHCWTGFQNRPLLSCDHVRLLYNSGVFGDHIFTSPPGEQATWRE